MLACEIVPITPVLFLQRRGLKRQLPALEVDVLPRGEHRSDAAQLSSVPLSILDGDFDLEEPISIFSDPEAVTAPGDEPD
jgi:hypothetical protein